MKTFKTFWIANALLIGWLGVFLILAATSCATVKSTAVKVEHAVIDCALPELAQEAVALLPAVVAILTGAPVDWQAQLDALAARGREALACAVGKVVAQSADPSVPLAFVRVGYESPSQRGALYLDTRSISVKNVVAK